MREYRAAFRLNARAPFGEGVRYGPVEGEQDAKVRIHSALDDMKRKPDSTGYEDVWIESREIQPWEREESARD